MKNDVATIKCPYCGQEYLPSEIYSPDAFFGKPKEVFRNPDGTIDFYIGEDPDYNEVYICDNCNHKLDISAKLAFTVGAYNEPEEFVSKIEKPEKIKLSEEELF